LWAKIPQAYRQHATFDTDRSVVYEGVMPVAQHRAISKLARQTHHLERFNNTLRQHVSRLVREALSFSKKRANHVGAMKLFICPDNLTRAAASSEHYMDITTPRGQPCIGADFFVDSCLCSRRSCGEQKTLAVARDRQFPLTPGLDYSSDVAWIWRVEIRQSTRARSRHQASSPHGACDVEYVGEVRLRP
jgi:hypothetical protein